MKIFIEMDRSIHQQKKLELELTEEQIEEVCDNFGVKAEALTYDMIHRYFIDGDLGEALAAEDDGWVSNQLEQDKKNWDGCCYKVVHDNGSISEYDYKKGFGE